VLLVTSLSSAQCSKDTECKGERVCEAGQCVPPSAPAPVAPTAVAPPAPAAVPAAPAPAAAPAAPPFPMASATLPAPQMQRHSRGMMVGGIVLVSLAPVALFVATLSTLSKALCSVDTPDRQGCDDYDAVTTVAIVSGLACVGAGVPLLVIGAKKERVDAPAAGVISRLIGASRPEEGTRCNVLLNDVWVAPWRWH
jgi:hypothetical protein